MMGKKEDCNQRRWAAHCLPAFPLPVVKIREVSSAMSLKHLSAVLARSLYCPKRVVPSSENLESMAACPSGKWSGKLCKLKIVTHQNHMLDLALCLRNILLHEQEHGQGNPSIRRARINVYSFPKHPPCTPKN